VIPIVHVNFLDPRLPERFWSKCIPEPNSGCWLWTAGVRDKKEGYGGFQIKTGVNRRVHQVAYEALIGEVPEDLQLDHKCRLRICCNPAHLEPVAQRINVLRGEGLAAQASRRTHCEAGHPYTEENTYMRVRRGRQEASRVCRQCKNAAERQARRRKKT